MGKFICIDVIVVVNKVYEIDFLDNGIMKEVVKMFVGIIIWGKMMKMFNDGDLNL